MDELTLPKLDLPDNGWVEFNDPEQLRGRDVDKMRLAWMSATDAGAATIHVMQAAAEVLIARWDLPGLPNFPVPADTPAMWGELGWRTKRAIENHLTPVMFDLVGLPVPAHLVALLKDRGDPQPPASE